MEGPRSAYVLKGIAGSSRKNEKGKAGYKILFVCKTSAWIAGELNQDGSIGKGTIN